jgi:hypothetical protein
MKKQNPTTPGAAAAQQGQKTSSRISNIDTITTNNENEDMHLARHETARGACHLAFPFHARIILAMPVTS